MHKLALESRALTRATLLAASVLSVVTVPRAQAANLYWDTDPAVAGTGGTGVWSDDAATNWSSVATGDTAAGAGAFTSADIAYFTGEAGVVTLAGPLVVGGLDFGVTGYQLTGGDLTLAGGSPSVRVGFGLIAELNARLSGTNGLTLTGGGALRLGNVANDFTGTTRITNGSLVISGAGALGSDTSAIEVRSSNAVPQNGQLYGYGSGSLVLDGSAGGFTFGRDINFEGRGPLGDRAASILSLGDVTLSGVLSSSVSPLTPVTVRNTRINALNGTLTLSGTLNAGGLPSPPDPTMRLQAAIFSWGVSTRPVSATSI